MDVRLSSLTVILKTEKKNFNLKCTYVKFYHLSRVG